jgi:hypothetical protein
LARIAVPQKKLCFVALPTHVLLLLSLKEKEGGEVQKILDNLPPSALVLVSLFALRNIFLQIHLIASSVTSKKTKLPSQSIR